MAKATAKSTPKLTELEKQNRKLAEENAKLKQKLERVSASSTIGGRFWKKFGVILCVALAGALLIAGNVLFWAGNTIVDTNKFVATTTPLIKDPAVQKGVADYTTKQIFSQVDVEQTLVNVLPPKADFLAPTLTTQLQSATNSTLQKVLDSPKFQTVWVDSVTKTHERTINFVKNYEGDGTISLNDVYQQLSLRLKDTKLSFLADKQLPSKIGSITVANVPGLPVAHNVVNNIGLYQWITILLLIGLSAAAIWLAAHRRRMVIMIGSIFSVLMLLSLVAIRVFQQTIPNQAQEAYRPAVSAAADILTQPLIVQTRVLLLLGLLTVIVAWVGGPYRSATRTRDGVQTLLAGHAHKAIFAHGENNFTIWVANRKRMLQWISVAIIAVIMLFVQLSPALVAVYALWMLAMVLIVELLAAPDA